MHKKLMINKDNVEKVLSIRKIQNFNVKTEFFFCLTKIVLLTLIQLNCQIGSTFLNCIELNKIYDF